MKFSQNHEAHFLCSTALLPCCPCIHAFEQITCTKMQSSAQVPEQLSVTVATPCSAGISALVPTELPAGLPRIQSMSVALAKSKAFPEP